MFWMLSGIPLVPTPPALAWELAGEGIGEREDGVPVFLAMHGEGARATLEALWKCSFRAREYFNTVSFRQRNIAMFNRDWQRRHKTANVFSCVDAALEKAFNDIVKLRSSRASEYTA